MKSLSVRVGFFCVFLFGLLKLFLYISIVRNKQGSLLKREHVFVRYSNEYISEDSIKINSFLFGI